MKTLEQLRAELEKANEACARYAPKSGQVNNCISDSEYRDQLHRHRQNLEFQINQLEKKQ
jgi:hypothetical protein